MFLIRWLFWVILLSLVHIYQVEAGDTLIVTDKFRSETFGQKTSKNSIAQKTTLLLDTNKWVPNTLNDIRLTSDTNHWLKVYISNQSNFDKSFLVFLQNVQIDTAELFVYNNDILLFHSPVTGCNMAARNRATHDRTMSLPILLKANTVHLVFIKVYRKEFGITVSPELCDPITGITFRWTDYFFLSVIVFNILFIVIGFIIKYQAKTKQIFLRELDWFLLYTSIGCLYLVAASGYGSLYIWGSYPWFEINAAVFFGALSSFGFLHFCKLALGIQKQYKYITWWFNIIAILYLSSAFLGFGLFFGLFPKGLLGALLGIFYLGMLSCIVVVVILALKKVFVERDKNFIWFLGIFVFHIAFVVVVMGLEVGTIVYNFKMHAWLTVLCYFPQMAVTLGFMSSRFVNTLEEKSRQLQMLRKDIAQDIHDEIGSQLTKISLSSHLISLSPLIGSQEIKSKILGLGQEAILANTQLRELLFAIHPTSDNFEVVQAFFRETASTYFENSHMMFHLEMHKKPYNPLMDRFVKSQLIMIYKEILANIAKHSKASNIWIKFVLMNEEEYSLEVRDDGNGFDSDKKISKGMGLKSIEDRCIKIRAKCKIKSKVNQGSEIQIQGYLHDQFVSR
ncbi:MAG: hypothetical protein IPG18_01865 [Saprospiraceae bacterium]|nr:hypothetical protein [Saprospiraceae bacterium]